MLQEELCPSCGKWTIIRDDTGWCSECSKGADVPKGHFRCIICEKIRPADHPGRKICGSCRGKGYRQGRRGVASRGISNAQHSYHPQGRPFKAEFKVLGTNLHVGYFADEISAARALQEVKDAAILVVRETSKKYKNY